jgi:hypothetical protein
MGLYIEPFNCEKSQLLQNYNKTFVQNQPLACFCAYKNALFAV